MVEAKMRERIMFGPVRPVGGSFGSRRDHLLCRVGAIEDLLACNGRLWSPEIQTAVRELGESLREHHAYEESKLLEELPPRLRPSMKKLFGEHESIVSAVDRVLTSSGDDRIAALREVTKMIRRHERAETAIYQRAFVVEVGGDG